MFADIHFSKEVKKETLDLILEQARQEKPDFICIPGDTLDSTGVLDDQDIYNISLDFFRKLGKIAPVIVSLGNHDYQRFANNKWFNERNENWFNKLKSINNIHLLENEILEIGDYRFIGYTQTDKYFFNETGSEDVNELIGDFSKTIPKFDDSKINILLFHSPIHALNEQFLEKVSTMKNVDFILSGHMHNGMVPKLLDKTLKCVVPNSNVGLVAPNKSLFPDNTRGIKIKYLNDKLIRLIITGGITKIQQCAPECLKWGMHFIVHNLIILQ